MYILGIETSCDETAASIVRDGKEILSNVIASQADQHEIFGGVVPELACRRHIDAIIPTLKQSLKEASLTLDQVDLIAAAYGPGLIGALHIGVTSAKALSLSKKIPFLAINHIEAHLYAALMSHQDVAFPCLGAVLSGGHTSLVLIESLGTYSLIAETIDDAIGEAFDKVAKMMGLPYPGGPVLEELAKQGDPYSYSLKAGHVKKNPLDFSFSGLKTAVLYKLKGPNTNSDKIESLSLSEKCNMAASFQRVAFQDVLSKILLAAETYKTETVIFGGGVTSSQTLRQLFSEKAPHLRTLFPGKGLSLDNAAMIAGLAFHKWQEKRESDSFALEPASRIPISSCNLLKH